MRGEWIGTAEPLCRHITGRWHRLEQPAANRWFSFRLSDGSQVLPPDNFVHDYASTPRFLHKRWPPDGPWGPAAIIHDLVGYTHAVTRVVDCEEHGQVCWPERITRRTGDMIFRAAMRASGVKLHNRIGMYTFVRIGGGPIWRAKHAEYVERGIPIYPQMPDYLTRLL